LKDGDLQKVAEIKYGVLPEIILKLNKKKKNLKNFKKIIQF
jgi:hypothetical protein